MSFLVKAKADYYWPNCVLLIMLTTVTGTGWMEKCGRIVCVCSVICNVVRGIYLLFPLSWNDHAQCIRVLPCSDCILIPCVLNLRWKCCLLSGGSSLSLRQGTYIIFIKPRVSKLTWVMLCFSFVEIIKGKGIRWNTVWKRNRKENRVFFLDFFWFLHPIWLMVLD